MYIKVSSVCSEKPHTLMLPLCWKTSTAAAPSPEWVLCALWPYTFQAKEPRWWALWPHMLLLWTVEDEEECSYSSHSPGLSAVIPVLWGSQQAVFPFAVFCRELSGTFFAVFKTGDVVMSLIWVPLTEVTSSNVGTVCRFTVEFRIDEYPYVSGVICMWSGQEMNTSWWILIQLDWGWTFYSFWLNNNPRKVHLHFKKSLKRFNLYLSATVKRVHFLSCMW